MATNPTIHFYCRVLPTCYLAKWIAYLRYSPYTVIIKSVHKKPYVWKFHFHGKNYLWFYWFTFKVEYL